MSPPLLGQGVEEGGHRSNDPLPPSPTTHELGLKEHNYFGFSDCSSVDSSTLNLSENSNNHNLNLKATELRLGLPGSQSPHTDRNPELCLSKLDEKPLFPLTPLKDAISSSLHKSGGKRGFSDTMMEPFVHNTHGPKPVSSQGKLPMIGPQAPPTKALHQLPCSNSNNSGAPAAKAQVVGWPPIRSFRKNTLATTSKDSNPLFVKVSMDGAPYLRKVDLRTYTTYQQLSSGLEKMFSCFTLGQCGSHGMSEIKLKDILHGSLTYEDKDGDWMLVGDVPWEMFIESCKRLKIMKSSDTIGLAQRAMEKSKSRN